MRIHALSLCCVAAVAFVGATAAAGATNAVSTSTVSTNTFSTNTVSTNTVSTNRVSTSLSPGAILFGDTVLAEIDVTIDTRLEDPSTIDLTTALGAWSIVKPATSTVSRGGPLLRRSYVLTIACRIASCVPARATRTVTLPAALVTVRTRAGKTVRLHARWPSVVEASRLPAGAATATKPPFLLQTTPPPLHPRVSPKLAADVLDAVAVLLVLGAGAIFVRELKRRLVRIPPPVPDLERALRLVREAEARPAPDRRRALALLARVVAAHDAAGLGADAAHAAWERESPSPETLGELARRTTVDE
jgi:hypothetical protein